MDDLVTKMDIGKSKWKKSAVHFEEERLKLTVDSYNDIWKEVKKNELVMDTYTKKIFRGMKALEKEIKKFLYQDN